MLINDWATRSTLMGNPYRFAAVLIIVIGIFGSTFCHADQLLPQTFNNARHGFSISFPADWAQMSAGKLESANRAAKAQNPEWKRPLLHYGYEMTNSAGLAFSPYVVIRVTDTGRAPDPKAIQDDLEEGDELPRGVQRDKPTFDQELNAYLQKNSVNITGVPPVEVFVACFLTKTGIIKMFFYTPPVGNGGIPVPIRQIIRSVQVHEEVKLPRPASGSRTGLIIALLAMVAVVLVLARARPAKCS
jgi:hypothetical protein